MATHTSWGDDELVEATAAGDRGAEAELFARYESALIGFVRARPAWRNRADDIIQEARFQALRAVRAGRFTSGSFRAYLFRIAANLGNTPPRSMDRRSVPLGETDPPAPGDTPPEPGPSPHLRRFQACLRKLGRGPAKIVKYIGAGGKPNRLAEALTRQFRKPMTVQNVYKIYQRAVTALETCMEHRRAAEGGGS